MNRTPPKVRERSAYPTFSESPTDKEIFRARVFAEALVPAGGTMAAEENQSLAGALTSFLRREDPEDFSSIESFLEEYPGSRWRASLLMNLGIVYRRASYFSRAERVLSEAWESLKNETEPLARATADRALAELLEIHMQFGRLAPLESLLSQIEERGMRGGSAERVSEARSTAWGLKNQHESAIPSGRVALERLLSIREPGSSHERELGKLHATVNGASLGEVLGFAGRVGLKMQAAHRSPGADVPTPAVMHLRAGHFTAVVEKRGEKYRLADPLLGGEVWMSARALEEEASGYFLIRDGALPAGWRKAEPQEVEAVRGKCKWPVPVAEATGQCEDQAGGCSGGGASPGMASYSFHTLLASLHITDTPVGYTPPRGPSVQFRVTYNQREYYQPNIFYYSNLGSRWTFDWMSYVEDDPSKSDEPVYVYLRGGGRETYSGFSGGISAAHVTSRAILVRTSLNRYERRLADGSM
ncbi:MAG: cysteine peptidase family C39 domain-containing protein, partial [Vicinamibacteria bacterium]